LQEQNIIEYLELKQEQLLCPYIVLQTVHWTDLIAQTENNTKPIKISETERKRREAVWELFTCECNFLIDHLMVLKHVSRLTLSYEILPLPW